MKASDAVELLEKVQDHHKVSIIFLIDDLEMYAEEEVRILKEKGYAAFLRQTAMGFEVVVTDKVSNAKIGSARPETS